jgi:DNA modification methylase
MDYSTRNTYELKQLCKERNIKGISGKTKSVLIDMLTTFDNKEIISITPTPPTSSSDTSDIKENTLYHEDCLKYLKKLPSESVNLTIADPPYYKVVHEKWDNIWKTEDEYLSWTEQWIAEVARVSKPVGSLYIFGYFRILCKIVTIVEKYGFKLRQNITISKGLKSISGRNTSQYQLFPTTTEHVLFFVKDNKKKMKEFLLSKQKEKGWTAKQINEKLGMKSNGGGVWSLYTGNNILEQYPTEELWHKLEDIFDFKMDYTDVRHIFNIEEGLTDVWTDIDFYEERKIRIHPTQKPYKLIKRLIYASSNPEMTVLDPFMGSGTTAIVCKDMNRKWFGCELNKEYFELTSKRLTDHRV